MNRSANPAERVRDVSRDASEGNCEKKVRDINSNTGGHWLWLSFSVLAVDRATKFVIERYTNVFFRRSIVSDVISIVHSQNPGIAFGFFSESTSRWVAPLLLLSATGMIALLVWLLLLGRAGGPLAHSGLALILGGAAGNALDRAIHGGVTDFIDVRLGSYSWPAFNVADSAITIGAVLVLIELLFLAPSRDTASDKRG